MNLSEYRDVALKISHLYQLMDQENDAFSKASGINCVSSCNGVCCTNKSVAVPPADLLPLALYLIENNQYLPFLTDNSDQACLFFKNGKCTVYNKRATLCRLFAYSSVYNKQGQKQLSICSYIRQEQKIEVEQTLINKAACIVDWSVQVSNLLPNWDSKCMPINQALKYALEKVLISIQYEETV